MKTKEIIERLETIEKNIKESGDQNPIIAGPARSRAIAGVVNLIRLLKEESE